jgi:hypothetical protein
MVAKLIVAEASRDFPTPKAKDLALRRVLEIDYQSQEYEIIKFEDVTSDDIGEYLCERRATMVN